MITADKVIVLSGVAFAPTVTLYGLSTDDKPTTGIGNGSAFVEINTGKIYFFNADASAWAEWGA